MAITPRRGQSTVDIVLDMLEYVAHIFNLRSGRLLCSETRDNKLVFLIGDVDMRRYTLRKGIMIVLDRKGDEDCTKILNRLRELNVVDNVKTVEEKTKTNRRQP